MFIGFVTLAGASGVSSSFSVFYSTLLQTFDWSHAGGASVYSVNQLVLAASAPVMGGCSIASARAGSSPLRRPRRYRLDGRGTLQSLGQFMLFYGC